ncbi:unnamed protein product [Prunus brigantina]
MKASQPRSPSTTQSAVEEELVKCYCCGLTEECTPEYIATEIKDENSRSHRGLSDEEVMKRHASFREEFRLSSPPAKSTEELISMMKQLLRRTLNLRKKRGWVADLLF